MVFVEFESERPADGKHYFVGTNLQTVLHDTARGKSFAGVEFRSYREISEKEVRALHLEFLESGIAAVNSGCPSYKLRTPR